MLDETERSASGWRGIRVRVGARNLRGLVLSNAGEIDTGRSPAGSDRPPPAPMGLRSKLQVALAIIAGIAGIAVFAGLIVACALAISDSIEKTEAKRPQITLPYTENFSAEQCEWPTSESERHQTSCTSGGLGPSVKQTNLIWSVFHKLSTPVEAARIEVDATVTEAVGEGAEEGFGLTCITRSYAGGMFALSTIKNGYRIGLEGENAGIWRRETSIKEILLAERPVPLPSATRIGAECVGGEETTTARLFLDGEEVLTIEEDRAGSFIEIGLYVLSDPDAEGSVTVLFDNFAADTLPFDPKP